MPQTSTGREGDIVKLDFIAGDDGREGEEGTKKLAAFSISLLLLLLSCLFNGIKVGIFASRWFGEGENFFRAYVKSQPDHGAKRKMINGLKFRGCCDNDAQREVQRVRTVEERGRMPALCFLVVLLNRGK